MLDTLDMKCTLAKKDFTKMRDERMEKLGQLQREVRAANIPVVILFEGWNGAGKGELINSLVQAMDPRGFKVHSSYYANEVERSKPFFWQYWYRLPAKGQIAIFDRSWYFQTIFKRVSKEEDNSKISVEYDDINSFERLLCNDNHIIIKFFAHISLKEHKKRLEEIEKQIEYDFRQINKDWQKVEEYDSMLKLYEDMFRQSDTAYAPWVAVQAHDLKFAKIKVLDYIINVLEKKLSDVKLKDKKAALANKIIDEIQPQTTTDTAFASSILNKVLVNKDVAVSKEDYEKEVKVYQKELHRLQFELLKNRVPMILAFEGWDAAGKGGTIRRITSTMDPRAYYVVPTSAPDLVDKNYNYLWRFWKEMPSKGVTAIFDRTWYGRVMVERVEGFASEEQWSRAYREINEMEDQLINSGNILLKFWLQIDKDEQLKRFEARQENEQKNWKITDEDWRNREKWPEYEVAVNEMLFRTSTIRAPWTIVESNCKRYGRLKAMKTVIHAIKKRLNM